MTGKVGVGLAHSLHVHSLHVHSYCMKKFSNKTSLQIHVSIRPWPFTMWLVPRGPCITGLYIDIARIKSTLQSLPDCLDDFMSFVPCILQKRGTGESLIVTSLYDICCDGKIESHGHRFFCPSNQGTTSLLHEAFKDTRCTMGCKKHTLHCRD